MNNKGSVLVYALVLTIVIATLLTGLLSFFLSAATQQKKYATAVQYQALLEEARSKVYDCLIQSDYPTNSCTPTTAQWGSCKPSKVQGYTITISFPASTPPNCRLKIEIEEQVL